MVIGADSDEALQIHVATPEDGLDGTSDGGGKFSGESMRNNVELEAFGKEDRQYASDEGKLINQSKLG